MKIFITSTGVTLHLPTGEVVHCVSITQAREFLDYLEANH